MIKIREIMIDYQKKNFVVDTDTPLFSWIAESDANDQKQKSYRIVVKKGRNIFWDSGKVKSEDSIYIKYEGKELEPNSVYSLKISVEATNGDKTDFEESFVSGKLKEKWTGKWISSNMEKHTEQNPPPDVFRKFISVKKGLERAVIYSTAMGVYKAKCNGEFISDDVNAPGFTSYNNRVQYQIYDLMPYLKTGENEIRVILGSGWYRGRIVNAMNSFGSRTGFNCEIHLFYKDGAHEVIITDKTWKWTEDGPLRFAEYYDGNIYDARREDETQWKWHEVWMLPKYEVPKTIVYTECPLMKKKHRLTPVRSYVTEDGTEFIWDFGQNHAGYVVFSVKASCGTEISVQYGEDVWPDTKKLYQDNLTNCRQEIRYTCKSDEWETYEPIFTTSGGQYVRVLGINSLDQIKIEAYVCYSDLDYAGEFECSVPGLNKLRDCIVWTQRSNSQDVPSDTPARYERMGWTGDFEVFLRTGVKSLDTQPFARKWLHDLMIDQSPSGAVPWVLPKAVHYSNAKESTPCGWADAAVVVPWVIYKTYGDKALLERQYNSMKKLVELEKKNAAWDSVGHERYLIEVGYHFGDWLMPYMDYPQWYESAKWLATCYFANSARILSRSAEVLGYEKDAKKYANLYENIRKAFCKKYILPDGTINSPYQGVYVCAIAFDLVTDKIRESVSKQLVEDIAKRDGCLCSGVLSVSHIMESLSSTGKVQEAYDLLFNEKMPGWLYMVNQGANTIWECWNGHGLYYPGAENIYAWCSKNHWAMGSVGDWMYRKIGGLSIDEAALGDTGYKHFTVEPWLCKRISYCKHSYNSVYGTIKVDWKMENGKFFMDLEVPFNCTATVNLPDGRTYEVGSGKHSYESAVPAEKLYN